MRFTRHYECDCGTAWEDDHHCACNDRCPKCNAEVEPSKSDDHLPQMIELFTDTETFTTESGKTLTDAVIDWLVEAHGWDRDELGVKYQRQDVIDELKEQLEAQGVNPWPAQSPSRSIRSTN